jgi:hypothetical protein
MMVYQPGQARWLMRHSDVQNQGLDAGLSALSSQMAEETFHDEQNQVLDAGLSALSSQMAG